MRRILLVICALATPAGAEPTLSARVGAAFGSFEDLTWEAPEVDLALTFRIAPRAFVSIAGGYAILDNHRLLSDGRTGRVELVGGVMVDRCWRAGLTIGVVLAGYHTDPDLLVDHPGVDLVASRGGVFPTGGFELARRLTSTIEVGAFARIGLTELEVFEAAGETLDARLILGGAFVGFAIR